MEQVRQEVVESITSSSLEHGAYQRSYQAGQPAGDVVRGPAHRGELPPLQHQAAGGLQSSQHRAAERVGHQTDLHPELLEHPGADTEAEEVLPGPGRGPSEAVQHGTG